MGFLITVKLVSCAVIRRRIHKNAQFTAARAELLITLPPPCGGGVSGACKYGKLEADILSGC